jgi:hypothetical protein
VTDNFPPGGNIASRHWCDECHEPFRPRRSDQLFCSHRCRQRAYKSRKRAAATSETQRLAAEAERIIESLGIGATP